MSSVEQRARDRLADAYDLRGWKDEANALRSGMPMDSHTVAALDTIAAALREQPGARGVVDDELLWWLNDATNMLAELGNDSHVPKLREIHSALTAAQQPVQEGGGARLTNPWTGEPRDYRDVNSDPAGTLCVEPGAPLKAAPPSAPVGVEVSDEFESWLAAHYLLVSELDRNIARAAWDAALTQQPAAVSADGLQKLATKWLFDDGYLTGDPKIDDPTIHRGAAKRECAQELIEHLATQHQEPTTPGDDAAGDGHGR